MPKVAEQTTETETDLELERAITLFTKVLLYRNILKNHNKIANSPIPKKKQEKYTRLLATCIMNTRNAETDLDTLYETLNSGQKIAFLSRSKELL